MESQVIYLGQKRRSKTKDYQINYGISSVLILLFLAFNIYGNTSDPSDSVIGWILIIGLFTYFVSMFLLIYTKSKFSAKIKVTNSEIELKNHLFQSAVNLKWIDIKSIEFDTYKLLFVLADKEFLFSYNTDSDTSQEIKRMIENFAANKQIETVAG